MAKETQVGDRLHGLNGSVTVTSIASQAAEPAYNLVVADFHTYFCRRRTNAGPRQYASAADPWCHCRATSPRASEAIRARCEITAESLKRRRPARMKTKHSILVPLAAQPAHRRSRGTAWRVSAAALLLLVCARWEPILQRAGDWVEAPIHRKISLRNPLPRNAPAQRQRPNGPQSRRPLSRRSPLFRAERSQFLRRGHRATRLCLACRAAR